MKAHNAIPRVMTPCGHCGTEFLTREDWVGTGKGRWCSRSCYDLSRQTRSEVACEYCGKTFIVTASRLGSKRFCNRTCQGLMSGGPTPTIPCAECGRLFKPERANWVRGFGKYCGKSCNTKAQIRNQPCLEERFWARVHKTDSCWLWTGGALAKGYGRFSLGKNREMLATHFAWQLVHGPVPPGMMLCHDCPGGDDPRCVRVSHLFLGTAADNTADMLAKGREARGTGNPNAVLTDDIVRDARARYAARTATMAALAKEYGVHVGTLRCAIRRSTWRHVI